MIQRHSPTLSFHFDPATLTGRLVTTPDGATWTIDLPAARGVCCGGPDPMRAEFPWTQHSRALDRLRPLRPADLRRARELPDGVELDFHVAGADFRITLKLGDLPDEFLCQLQPLVTGRADLIAAELPGPLSPPDGQIQVLVNYRHQGRLFTGAPGALETERPDWRELPMGDGRQRLRFFGLLGDRERIGSAAAGYIAIIEENADSRIMLRQADGGKLTASVQWWPSHGTLAYPRTIRYRFQARPTVTTLAKSFRRYAQSVGMFKSLKDKIAERPAVGKMIGATACFIGYEACDQDYVATFRRLREMGHKAFYAFPTFHINLGLPDIFAGFPIIDIRDQTAALRALGAVTGSWTYLAGTLDLPDRARLSSRNPDGTTPLNWQIGDELWPQACMTQAELSLAGQRESLMHADGTHFDTTASNPLMECYAPSHPMDRRGDRAARIALLDQATRLGRFVASEGVKDWAVPHYDMGSNKEIPLKAETPAFRVVPVQHLVYHDALFMLWWEVDCYDVPHFHGGDLDRQSLTDLLYGDMPLIFPVGRQYRWVGEGMAAGAVEFEQSLDMPHVLKAAERAVAVARQFERVATEEMTDFAWLTPDGTAQQTQFANGQSVIANFGPTPFPAENGALVPPLAAISLPIRSA